MTDLEYEIYGPYPQPDEESEPDPDVYCALPRGYFQRAKQESSDVPF